MTAQEPPANGDLVLTLQQLLRRRMEERGWNYADLERRGGHRLTRQRIQQLGTGKRMAEFPEPETLDVLANALEIDVAAIILAAGRSVGLDARRRGSGLAQLLPAGTEELSEAMQDAILAVIRVAVAEGREADEGPDGADAPDRTESRAVTRQPAVQSKPAGKRSPRRKGQTSGLAAVPPEVPASDPVKPAEPSV